MNRNDTYEKGKISKAADEDSVMNIYFDAFSIEKVRFQNASPSNKTSIECYVDFEDVAILATDAANGNLIKELKNSPIIISTGGSKSSKRFNGAPESRTMSVALSDDIVIVEMIAGKGKLSETGLILPDGQPDKQIRVAMPIKKFRSMIIYTHDCVKAYLSTMVSNIVNTLENDRKKYLDSTKDSNSNV